MQEFGYNFRILNIRLFFPVVLEITVGNVIITLQTLSSILSK